MEISFEKLPEAVTQLFHKLENIEQLLLQRSNVHPSQDHFLTISEAARFLKLSVPTIYSLVSQSKIPVSKQGKRLYFSEQELIGWIKAGRKKTVNELSTEANQYLKGISK